MRIIAGYAKGRQIKSIPGLSTRPLLEKVRGAIFNILRNEIMEKEILDLYSGTGSIGLEALSRGAKSIIFIDNNLVCVQTIQENLKNLGFADYATVYKNDIEKALAIIARKEFKFDIIFIDPPYLKNLCEMNLKLVEKINILRNSGIIVIHHHKKEILPEKFKNIYLSDKRKYGDAIISMYSIKSSSP
ncbi:MAG: 16S rRNA (guanine(966)-N(2))-methyltransferase RsmD [Candidatus Firestonebacteria bacterium]